MTRKRALTRTRAVGKTPFVTLSSPPRQSMNFIVGILLIMDRAAFVSTHQSERERMFTAAPLTLHTIRTLVPTQQSGREHVFIAAPLTRYTIRTFVPTQQSDRERVFMTLGRIHHIWPDSNDWGRA